MFATLIVILPSKFSGGEIHVSHRDTNMVFDNAKDSAFETTTLAWYIQQPNSRGKTNHLRLSSRALLPPDQHFTWHQFPTPTKRRLLSAAYPRDLLSRWLDYPPFEMDQVFAYVSTQGGCLQRHRSAHRFVF